MERISPFICYEIMLNFNMKDFINDVHLLLEDLLKFGLLLTDPLLEVTARRWVISPLQQWRLQRYFGVGYFTNQTLPVRLQRLQRRLDFLTSVWTSVARHFLTKVHRGMDQRLTFFLPFQQILYLHFTNQIEPLYLFTRRKNSLSISCLRVAV